ncbi:transcription factor FAMA-like [Primulina huaijiensis]|uniref:transcription factor FAMA-like n=1 Tax=Primulina huaijiensis TaxID=1492673 RepID=UPI003CC7170D
MEKDGSYLGNLPGLDYSLEDQTHDQELMKQQIGETSTHQNTNQMVDYMINTTQSLPPQPSLASNFCGSSSFDKLSFADVMQFSDFGPKLALNQAKTCEEESGMDPVYFLKFPVLNDKLQEDHHLSLMAPQNFGENQESYKGLSEERIGHDQTRVDIENINASAQLRFLGENLGKRPLAEGGIKSKKKRPRTSKTSEEVESQRMTHIAVERNRRKQMNEHLRVLRSLMPSSYVQRSDQASIIGGAIEFVRELEQLLQCLESQKRRRLYGDGQRPGEMSLSFQTPQPPLIFPPVGVPNDHQGKLLDYESGLQEETGESKSCLADVEVKVLGFDALIKILSRRRVGQLVKLIAALEDLQLSILHTNITTIEQTVLYSYNVKIGGEARVTAEDIANSVQQIFSFIHANSGI